MSIASIKKAAKRILPSSFFARKFYAQNAEDVYLLSLLRNDKIKFYIDVGCNHPFRDNNTYLFYKMGWRGINIDALPENISLCKRMRKRDVNLNYGVHESGAIIDYWEFDESAVNTFDQESAKRAIERGRVLKRKRVINVLPLADILDEHLDKHQTISFMSVDVEGVDLQVLKSNDWEKYRPKCVLVEINDLLLNNNWNEHEIVEYLISMGYTPYGKTINNWIFVDSEQFIKKLHSDKWWIDE